MQVQFDQKEDDIIAFNMFHMKHSPAMRRQRRFITWGVLCLGTACSLWISNIWPFLVAVLWAALFFGLIRILSKRNIRKLIREGRNAGLLGPCIVTISLDGIAKKTEVSETRYKWSSIERIAVTDKHAFVYLNALTVFIMPKRAFGLPSEFAGFVSQAQQYVDAARQPSTSSAEEAR